MPLTHHAPRTTHHHLPGAAVARLGADARRGGQLAALHADRVRERRAHPRRAARRAPPVPRHPRGRRPQGATLALALILTLRPSLSLSLSLALALARALGLALALTPTPTPTLDPNPFTDLQVRRGALLALNCVAHNKPAAVREALPELLPMLYEQTKKRPELVHQVDLGPFKHTVDDGLELRKAAFECMDTLLDGCPDRLKPTPSPSPSPSPSA